MPFSYFDESSSGSPPNGDSGGGGGRGNANEYRPDQNESEDSDDKTEGEEDGGEEEEDEDDKETLSNSRSPSPNPQAWLPDGYSQIFRSYVFCPSGFWTMAPLCYAAKFDPFLSLDCAPTPSTLAQRK